MKTLPFRKLCSIAFVSNVPCLMAYSYVLGCTKFGLNSSVDLDSPRLSRYLRLAKDHMCIGNDLASWEKEKRAYDTGNVLHLLNSVAIAKDLFYLSTDEAAMAMVEALQLQIEVDIDTEIQRMMHEDALMAEEWRFVDAILYALRGNIFASTIMSRYGGEASKLV